MPLKGEEGRGGEDFCDFFGEDSSCRKVPLSCFSRNFQTLLAAVPRMAETLEPAQDRDLS